MGKTFAKICQVEEEDLQKAERSSMMLLLKQLNPEEVLACAEDYMDIYDMCMEDPTLRQACIIGAVRRYHAEKLIVEEVHNRTARYVRILDTFLAIQDDQVQEDYFVSSSSARFFRRYNPFNKLRRARPSSLDDDFE